MKIAVVTNNQRTIGTHFGCARYFLVFEVEEGRIVGRELREKPVRHQGGKSHRHRDHSCEHGVGPGSHEHHRQIVAVLTDCDVVITRGMGRGAFDAVTGVGVEPIVTDLRGVEDAVHAYLDGMLVHYEHLVHE